MLIQIKTASTTSEPADYIEQKFVRFDDYDKWANKTRKDNKNITTATILEGDLQEVYDAIDFDSIVVGEPNGYDYPAVDLVVYVYDGHME